MQRGCFLRDVAGSSCGYCHHLLRKRGEAQCVAIYGYAACRCKGAVVVFRAVVQIGEVGLKVACFRQGRGARLVSEGVFARAVLEACGYARVLAQRDYRTVQRGALLRDVVGVTRGYCHHLLRKRGEAQGVAINGFAACRGKGAVVVFRAVAQTTEVVLEVVCF